MEITYPDVNSLEDAIDRVVEDTEGKTPAARHREIATLARRALESGYLLGEVDGRIRGYHDGIADGKAGYSA